LSTLKVIGDYGHIIRSAFTKDEIIHMLNPINYTGISDVLALETAQLARLRVRNINQTVSSKIVKTKDYSKIYGMKDHNKFGLCMKSSQNT